MAAHPQSQPNLLAIEDVVGGNRPVTIVRFLADKLMNPQTIQTLGQQLYSLVDEHGRSNLLLNLGNIQIMSTEVIGKLVGLQKRINVAKGHLALCQISSKINPVVDEAFEVCGLKKFFTIYADEQEALQAYF